MNRTGIKLLNGGSDDSKVLHVHTLSIVEIFTVWELYWNVCLGASEGKFYVCVTWLFQQEHIQK